MEQSPKFIVEVGKFVTSEDLSMVWNKIFALVSTSLGLTSGLK